MKTTLVDSTRIYATLEAHECYDLLCGTRQVGEDILTRRNELLGGKPLFHDTVQGFYTAAAIGHLVRKGKKYDLQGKIEGLILRQQWDRAEKEELRKAFTYLAKLEYGAKDEKESLQIVAELAETGIRFIRDKVVETHEFDFQTMLDPLRRLTKGQGDLE
jgi:hypothetical protein